MGNEQKATPRRTIAIVIFARWFCFNHDGNEVADEYCRSKRALNFRGHANPKSFLNGGSRSRMTILPGSKNR
jgi:hypothetical protein